MIQVRVFINVVDSDNDMGNVTYSVLQTVQNALKDIPYAVEVDEIQVERDVL